MKADAKIVGKVENLALRPQLHVGSTSFEEIKPVKNRMGFNVKPTGGFWTSTFIDGAEKSSAWTDFCNNENFKVPEDGLWKGMILVPRKDARIYVINSYEDLGSLITRYPCLDIVTMTIDFETVSQIYDAIHLTSRGESETRYTTRFSLYGWDCESTLWFRNVFDTISPVSFNNI